VGVGILKGELGLADPAKPVHGLRLNLDDCSGMTWVQAGVELVEQLGAAGEHRIAWGYVCHYRPAKSGTAQPVQNRLGWRRWQVDVDATGVADGDQLANPRVPRDRRGQPADGRVVFGLADQPGQLAGERAVFGGEDGQDLGQRANRRRILRPVSRIVEDCRDVMVGGGALDQLGELGLARPGACGLDAMLVNSGGGQQARRGQRGRFGRFHRHRPA
jgi:hypothetical protein